MTKLRSAIAAAVARAHSERTSNRGRFHCLNTSTACALAFAVGLGGAANAEEAQKEQLTLEEITVTGSRIRRNTDFDSPNPTTVMDSEFLQNLGIVNIGDAVKQLPSNLSNNTPSTTGNANFFAGSTIPNLRGLNPFFGSRTLTLVNNRRFVPTNQGDGVDLNMIPSVLIERMDVVTGGASAAYGSGAISGVNNIFLNRKLEGGKAEIDYYLTEEGDGDDMHLGLAYGFSLFGDRGHLVLGYERQKSDPVGCIEARDWCAEGKGFYATSGTPAYALGSNLRANQISSSGVFMSLDPGATQTLQATADGTGTTPFNLGAQPYSSVFSSAAGAVEGGDGRSIYEYTNLRAPVERDVAAGTFTLAVTDAVNMSIDVSYGKTETINQTGALDATYMFIRPDNAYIQGSQALIDAVGATGSYFNKDWTSQVNSHSVFTTEVKRAALGFDGGFGDSSWTWDAYYQFGETDREQLVADNRHLNAYNLATDAVFDDDGNIVCRVTRDGVPDGVSYDPRIAENCVPLNPFGTQAISQAAHDYAFGYLRENLNYKQQVLAANVSGDLFAGFGAGPIQAAAGIEYRTEKGRNIAAEELDDWVRTDFLIQYGESFSGDVDVTEGFVELNIPLLRDRPGAQVLELNTAARQSRYENQGLAGTTGESRSHDMTTWKVSAVWDPIDSVRLRATQSRDMRAANFRELYYGQIIHAGGVFGYCGPTGTTFADPCDWSLEGNVDLEPEKADTTTFGIVWTPENWIPGLQLAADYFRIEISDAIQQASVRRVLDGCQISGIQEYCDLIVPDVPGSYSYDPGSNSGIETVRALAFNGSGYWYKGVDFTGNYFLPLNDGSALNFRLIATKMIEQVYQPLPGGSYRNLVGQTGTSNSFLSDNQPAADFVANLSATYNRGPFTVTGQARYVDDGIVNYLGVGPEDSAYPTPPTGGTTLSTNRVASYAVFGLSGSYTFDDVGPFAGLQVWTSIDNLFDRDPPVAAGSASNANGGTNAVYFDTMGRAYRLGLRMNF